jgi:1-phosphatidylinositol-4-phosphate 5-kinase
VAGVKKLLSLKRHPSSISEVEDAPIEIGTKIDRNHENFMLMYNMLTGIRMGVRLSVLTSPCH